MLDLDAVHLALAAYLDAPGLLQVCSADDWSGRAFATDPAGIALAAKYVRELDEAGASGIYHRGTTVRTAPGAGQRGKADDSAVWLAVRLDLDYGKDDYAPNGDTVREIVEDSALPRVTEWVHSGHGLYPVWTLAEPVPDSPDMRALVRDLHACAAEAFAALGYLIDSGVTDAARVWRIPGTVNRKREPVLSEVVEHGGEVYALDELRAAVPAPDAGQQESPNAGHAAGDRVFTVAQAKAYIEPGLVALRSAVDGGRNIALNAAAVRIGHFVSEGFGTTFERADQTLRKNLPPGYGAAPGEPAEITATIRSGLTAGMAEPYTCDRTEPVSPLDEAVRPPALHLQTFAELAAEVDAAGEPQWLVRGVIAAGDYGVLGGESKTQKTWNAVDLAVAVAAGTSWFGSLPIDKSGPVIVFVGEGGKRNIVRRVRATAAAHGVRAECLPIHVCARAPKLADKIHMGELADMIENVGPVLVVLDPLYLAASGADKGDLYGMGALLERPQHLCQAAGASLLVVHHFNRQNGGDRGRLSGAGPAEWGRFLITATVRASGTFAENKRSRVVAYLTVVGGEVADQTYRVERYVWTDDPNELGSPMHVIVSAVPVAEAEPDTASGTSAANLDEAVWTAVGDIVEKGQGATGRAVNAIVPGRATAVAESVERLVIHGRLTRTEGPRGAQLHHQVTPTASQDQEECDSP